MPEHGISKASLDPDLVARIVDAVASLQFGIVEITVHDGRVVQIERREKIRLDSSGRGRA